MKLTFYRNVSEISMVSRGLMFILKFQWLGPILNGDQAPPYLLEMKKMILIERITWKIH